MGRARQPHVLTAAAVTINSGVLTGDRARTVSLAHDYLLGLVLVM